MHITSESPGGPTSTGRIEDSSTLELEVNDTRNEAILNLVAASSQPDKMNCKEADAVFERMKAVAGTRYRSQDVEEGLQRSTEGENTATGNDTSLMVNTFNCLHNEVSDVLPDSSNTFLQLQILQAGSIKGKRKTVTGLWDGGSTLCFITFDLAKLLRLQ